jgi:hypothetical protein
MSGHAVNCDTARGVISCWIGLYGRSRFKDPITWEGWPPKGACTGMKGQARAAASERRSNDLLVAPPDPGHNILPAA